eukprot:1178312-Prorocentrum_minimum.AAC.1
MPAHARTQPHTRTHPTAPAQRPVPAHAHTPSLTSPVLRYERDSTIAIRREERDNKRKEKRNYGRSPQPLKRRTGVLPYWPQSVHIGAEPLRTVNERTRSSATRPLVAAA